jgi:hypothetical protein
MVGNGAVTNGPATTDGVASLVCGVDAYLAFAAVTVTVMVCSKSRAFRVYVEAVAFSIATPPRFH